MTDLRRMLFSFLASACLLSCSAEEQLSKVSCPLVGQRIHEQPVRGIIYGSVGAKVQLDACPRAELPFAFIGDVPAEYERLKQLAQQREDLLGFNAVGDGYVVTDAPGEYVLLLITLDEVREDASVAKAVKGAAG